MFKRLLHIIVLPCDTVTYLMERKLDSAITCRENMQLRLHITICKWCKVYNKKMRIIHKIISKAQVEEIEKYPDLQSVDFERIKFKIKEGIKK